MRAASFAALLVLVSVPAAADPVSATGVPAGDADAVLASLQQARSQMAVCWVKSPPPSVKIAVTVAASGDVTKAAAKTKGAAAQCAAGILAVATLAPSKPWKGVVTLEVPSSQSASDAEAIQGQLAKHQADFYACQGKASDYAGKVKLTIEVEHDGTLDDVAATADADAGKPVAACVAAVAKKLTLSPIASGSVKYGLALAFGGGGGGGSTYQATGADPSLAPSLKGPLQPEDLQPILATAKAALGKCVKGEKARGKVVARVTIGDDGKVTSSKVKSSELGDAAVEGCLTKVLGGLTFRKAGGETVLLYPMRVDDDGLKTGG